MSRCTSERPAGGSAESGGTEGSGEGVHDGFFAAGEWESSSVLSASSRTGWAGAQAVLSRRPGLVPLAARLRALLLSLRALPVPRGPRSLLPAGATHRAQASLVVAMTIKPACPPTRDCLFGAPGYGGLLTYRGVVLGQPGRGADRGAESAFGCL